MRDSGKSLAGKQVLVFGAGKSGVAASSLLVSCHAHPVLYDGNESLTEEAVRESSAIRAARGSGL